MNRLQKKCFIASAGFHLLLALILLVGPAFLSPGSKEMNLPELNFVPSKLVDDLVSNPGAASKGTPQPPQPQPLQQPVQPPAPPTVPKTQSVVEKTPLFEPKPQITPTKPEPESLEPAKSSKRKIEVSTKPVIRNTSQETAKARAAAEARAVAERNRRIASALNRAASNIAGSLSGSTDVDFQPGEGGNGVSYGNWFVAVKLVYIDAWIVPDGVTDDSATVAAKITVARDGTVTSTSITRFSGNSLVDQSVKATLDRVRKLPALPEGAKESERSVTINFNVKAKQGLG